MKPKFRGVSFLTEDLMMMLASEKHGKKQGSTRAANQPDPNPDGIERLISAPSTPKSGNFKGIKDPVNANDGQETEQANAEETHEDISLEAEMENLAELNQRKEISVTAHFMAVSFAMHGVTVPKRYS